MIRCESCGASSGDERGAGRRSGADKLPQSAGAGTRTWTRSTPTVRRATGADPDRRVQPVVPVHPVDHRDAANRRREGRSARRPDPRRARRRAGQAVRRRARGDPRDGRSEEHRPDRRVRRRAWPTAVADGAGAARTPRSSAGDSSRPGIRSTCSSPSGGTCRSPRCSRSRRTTSGLMVTEMPRGPAAAREDHPGPGGEPDAEGQRARRLHPPRRDGPGRRPAQPAGPADPQRQTRRGCRRPKTAARESSCSSTSTRSRRGRARISARALWEAHRAAHTGATSAAGSPRPPRIVDPDTRLPPPRYWLLHTLAHVLIREMAMSCGYGAPA